MTEKGEVALSRLLVVLLIHTIIVGILIISVFGCLKTRTLKNDAEEIEIAFNENVNYASSLYTKVNIDKKIPVYSFEIFGIKPKNESETSVISFYFRKRLPKNDTINCLIIYYNGSFRECKYFSKDPTNPLNNFSYYSPINIEDYLTEDLNKIILTYSCPKCNVGGLEIQVEGDRETNIFDYFFEISTFPYLIENVYESNTKSSKTSYGSFQALFEGPLKFENNRINSIVIKIIGISVYKEILYLISISLLAGIFLYWIHKLSDFMLQRKKNNPSRKKLKDRIISCLKMLKLFKKDGITGEVKLELVIFPIVLILLLVFNDFTRKNYAEILNLGGLIILTYGAILAIRPIVRNLINPDATKKERNKMNINAGMMAFIQILVGFSLQMSSSLITLLKTFFYSNLLYRAIFTIALFVLDWIFIKLTIQSLNFKE